MLTARPLYLVPSPGTRLGTRYRLKRYRARATLLKPRRSGGNKCSLPGHDVALVVVVVVVNYLLPIGLT